MGSPTLSSFNSFTAWQQHAQSQSRALQRGRMEKKRACACSPDARDDHGMQPGRGIMISGSLGHGVARVEHFGVLATWSFRADARLPFSSSNIASNVFPSLSVSCSHARRAASELMTASSERFPLLQRRRRRWSNRRRSVER